ncbi:PREDICTED: 26S proteasome non-ATPase regulatory subunit 9 [Nicrophorus vespilloides]|uniref:26S proteasome non-ATPase regulatory subunit 9 n=1 Tax=Nicrophorus vespilloides TaxID=110193 RepID=A0ABM1NIC1_NICVS|nr:PREDICTED: 26S proteasome non-ATPase regulatory subunit 9 [Nicrophorus vespilloides]
MDKNLRQQVLTLIEEKEALENEIRELNQILVKNNVGMDDPLVDAEGFPLSHVDINQVRHARHLIIHKQNDHKALMNQIEQGISEYYAEPHENMPEEEKIEAQFTEPFARITIVNPGSPAYCAGIVDGDLLVQFGSVNSTNFRNVRDIGTVVQHSEGHAIRVSILRNNRLMCVQLTPKKWSGIGLLGCTVNPC